MTEGRTWTEKVDVKGGHLAEKVRELIHEGNVRRIIITNAEGKPVLEMPVTVGVVGILAAPAMAAVGALAAIASDYSIEVEREHPETVDAVGTPPTKDTTDGTWFGPTAARRSLMGANEKLLDDYVERYNAGDLDTVMTLYADDASQAMHDGTFVGRDAIRKRLASDFAAFSDLTYSVTRFLEQGDDFADEWTITGRHTGPFHLPDGTEIPPTGRRVEVKGMEFVRVRDGKIVIDNLYYDSLALVAQLGLLPQSAPVPAG